MDFNPAILAKLLLLVVTTGAFLGAIGLQVSTSLALRRYAPVGSRPSNMDQYIIHRYAFEPTVPRALQRKYLLSLVLGSLSFGGIVVVALMQPNYLMTALVGLVFLVGVWVSISSWKRYARHGSARH